MNLYCAVHLAAEQLHCTAMREAEAFIQKHAPSWSLVRVSMTERTQLLVTKLYCVGVWGRCF